MRVPALVITVLLAGSGVSHAGGDFTGGLTTGAITAPIHGSPPGTSALVMDTERPDGVELRGFLGWQLETPAIPNASGFMVRQLGEGVQTSIQLGWMIAPPVGRSTLFARLMFDVISWTEVADETTLSAFSPTAEIGIAPWGHGVCVAASTTWDVQFNQPDRMIVGGYVGLCGGAMDR